MANNLAFRASTSQPRGTLALIGGGRWARVIASVLASADLQLSSVVVVSRVNAARLTGLLAQPAYSGFTLVPTIDELLDRFEIGGAIIANAARAHVDSARRLIEAGIPVLVEKPLALSVKDVARLLDLAGAKQVCLAPSLAFLHCSYLHRFAEMIAARGGAVRGLTLRWEDPPKEDRHGETKSYDPGISVAQDVMPHVWSIIRGVAGQGRFEALSCRISGGGRRAFFRLQCGDLPCRVAVARDAPRRQRLLEVELLSGEALSLDFTSEPGTIRAGATSQCADPLWGHTPFPLQRQIEQFLLIRHRRTPPNLAQASLGSVELAEHCDSLLKRSQEKWIGWSRPHEHFRYALRDLLSPRLYEEGRVAPGDTAMLDKSVEGTMRRLRANKDSAELRALIAQGAPWTMPGPITGAAGDKA